LKEKSYKNGEQKLGFYRKKKEKIEGKETFQFPLLISATCSSINQVVFLEKKRSWKVKKKIK